MKTTFPILMLLTIVACSKTPAPEEIEISGRYNGTIEGSFYPSDFPATSQVPFTEPATFEVSVGDVDGSITGFDSVSTQLSIDKTTPSQFSISDIREGGDLRLNASGRCHGDTLEMTGTYYFLDRSRRTFRFIGLKDS